MNPTARMIMLTAALGALLAGCSVKVEDAAQPEPAKTPIAAGETAQEGNQPKEAKQPSAKETAPQPAEEAKPAANAKSGTGAAQPQPKDAAAGADGAAASASKPADNGGAKPADAGKTAAAAKSADGEKSTSPAPRNPAAAAVGSAAAKPAPAQGTGDRKALSWYYMKKSKGQVPSFPGETKTYPEGTKALWVGTGKKVYLTIDTGGPLGDTKLLLKSLRDNKAKANFFIAGYNVKKDPDFVRQLVKDGHLVANHTMTHTDMNEQTDEQIVKEIRDYEKLYKEVTGENIQPYFRFPYGRYNMHILKTVSDMGYTSVFWSTAMRDWEPRKNGAEDPYNDIMNNLHDGNIILMHQGSPENIQALDRIIKEVRGAGYEFALLTDIKPPASP
ncbi:polysaccharide deacetylase family protein [Paenibacillus sp. S-38]|uniref:delta-lactam-biosynthetic de-N-acetylase n=1 Tax=Paenibacillus sp. S-38 TaxID=3416710 RepID=UPI003CE7B746